MKLHGATLIIVNLLGKGKIIKTRQAWLDRSTVIEM